MPRVTPQMRAYLNSLGYQVTDEHDVNMRARVESDAGFVAYEPFKLPAPGDEVILTSQATLRHTTGAVTLMASTDDPGTWGPLGVPGQGYTLLENH